MSRIDPAEVRRIARLAGLRLGEDEVERLAVELGDILAHFLALPPLERAESPGGVDRRSLPARPGSPLRGDEPGSDPLGHPPEEAAPAWREGLFVVPRLPGLDEAGG